MKKTIYCSACLAEGKKEKAVKKISVKNVHYEFCENCYFNYLLQMNKEADKFIGQVILFCLRCGHSWLPRGTKHPTVCPTCKSPYWDKKTRTPIINLNQIK